VIANTPEYAEGIRAAARALSDRINKAIAEAAPQPEEQAARP